MMAPCDSRENDSATPEAMAQALMMMELILIKMEY